MRAAECGQTDNTAIMHIVETRIVTAVVTPGGIRAREHNNHFRAWHGAEETRGASGIDSSAEWVGPLR